MLDRLDGVLGALWFFAIYTLLGRRSHAVTRRVSIFGATGSVGCNTVSLIEAQGGAEAYEVVALTGAGNVALLAEQARRLRARIAVTADPARYGALRAALAGIGRRGGGGTRRRWSTPRRRPADWTMSAIVGAAGLAPGLAAARARRGAGARQQGEPRLRRRSPDADLRRAAARR